MALFQNAVLNKYLAGIDEGKAAVAWELFKQQFLGELKKKKVILSISEEAEWKDFNQQKTKADELKSQIFQTDKEIDQMVYELNGLTREEVRIVDALYCKLLSRWMEKIRLTSINQNFEAFEVTPGEAGFEIIGEVVWHATTSKYI